MIPARLLLVFVAGCYQPTVATGVPCPLVGECPAGQACDLVTNRCELPSGVDATLDDAPPDAAIDAVVDAAPLGPWGAPVALTSLDSTDRELDPSLTTDGLEIFFASSRTGGTGPAGTFDIFHATRTSVTLPFDAPVRIVELSSSLSEVGPDISGDGLTVYLYRQLGQFDIFTATRPTRTAAFTVPVKDMMLSTTLGDDRDPQVTDSGLFASVQREVTTNNQEQWVFSRAAPGDPWGTPRQLTELSTNFIEGGGTLDDTATTLIFHSDRITQNQVSDLYIVTRATPSDPFGVPMPIVELNTTGGDEENPDISDDLRTIVFDRGGKLFMSTR